MSVAVVIVHGLEHGAQQNLPTNTAFGALTAEFPQKTSTPALNTPPLSTCFVTPTAMPSLWASKRLFHYTVAALLLVPDMRLVSVLVLAPRRRLPRAHLTNPQAVTTRVTEKIAAVVTARVQWSGVDMPTVLEKGIGGIRQGEK